MVALRTVPADERPWLRNWLVIAYVSRIGVAVFFEIFRDMRIFHEDSEGYEAVAVALAKSWWGSAPPLVMGETNVGFYYMGGGICFLFGPYPLSLPLFNSLLGTATTFLIYRAARNIFHLRVTRMATLLVGFTPSMILWSAIALKDAVTTFLIVVSLVSCMTLKRKLTLQALFGTVAPIIAIQPLRFYLVYFMIFGVLGSLLMDRGLGALTGVYKQLFLLAFIVGVFAVTGLAGRTLQSTEYLSFEKVHYYRLGLATSARSGFSQDVDISTPGKALAFLPVGMANLLFGPFPWQLSSLRAVVAMPETIAWWFLVPATWRGLKFTARRKFSEISPILLFSFTLMCAYSLVHGNVGSGFRQRSQVFVFLFMFTALGWFQKKCTEAGIDHSVLIRSPEPGAT
ncbi:MAG TPA: hypothetical protein VN914_06735 [Polyangia bacterium]|nr:hypothetical protein [Polyangia bacterium]